MLLERYYDDGLAQASYLIGCERTGRAIVVDPNRDVQQYVDAAAKHRMRIAYVTETHIHADYLSGSLELARRARAELLLSSHGGDDWAYGIRAGDGVRFVREGDCIDVGDVRLSILHTPGHTPEHICFVVTDTAVGDRPVGMLTGDFVFVGDVGRPDLLERAANVKGSMDAAARQLYASIQRLHTLPDYLQLWPGHGAGSACGKSLGAVPQTTLGYERLYNPAFQRKTETDFVDWVLADQPEPPRYFAEMKRRNRDGDTNRRGADATGWVSATEVQVALRDGHWVIDARRSADFAAAHLRGTINIPESRSFATYVGTVVTYDRPLVVIVRDEQQAARLRRQLSFIGHDLVGWAKADDVASEMSAGRPADTLQAVAPTSLAGQPATNGPLLIDVRGRSEWNHGHIPRATHIFLGDLEARAADLRRDEAIVVHCESGTRASIGASLLRARGFANVAILTGGMTAWRKAGLPVQEEHS